MTQPTEPLWTRDFILMMAGAFLQGMSFFLLMPVLPLLVVGPLGGTQEQVGVVVGIFSLTAVSVRPFGGYLLDRHGRRMWLRGTAVALCGASVAYLLCAHSYPLLIAVRLLHGFAWGVAGITAATVAADLIPADRRGTGMGWYGMAMPIGLTIGPMLGAGLLQHDRFDRVFQATVILSFLALACFLTVRPPKIEDPLARIRLDRLFEPKVLHLAFFMVPLCIGYGGWVAFAPLYATHIGMDTAGPLFSVYAVGGLLPRVLGGKWYDRFGPGVPGMVGLGIVIAGWSALTFLPWEAGALAGAACLGMGFGTLMPAFQAMTMDLVPPERRGAANATVFSSYDVGIAVGSMGLGMLTASLGLSSLFFIAGLLTILSSVYFWLAVLPFFRRNRLP